MSFSVLNLLLVLICAFAGGRLALRLGYPAVLGEIMVGIVLGPPVLGLMQAGDALTVLADLGILLMMMYVGMEVNLSDLRRASRAGVVTALGGFILPFGLGVVLMLLWGQSMNAALFVGVAMGVTSLATKSRILLDLGILNTRIASVMMAGALVTDTLSLLIFAGIIGVATAGSLDIANLGLLLLKTLLFFGVSWLLGMRIFPILYRWLRSRGLTERGFYGTLSLMIALAFAELAELAGLHGVLGAFLAGMFLREAISERRLSHEVSELVGDVSVGFLAPIFFLTAGFEVSFGVFRTNPWLLFVVITVATLGKIAGTLLAYRSTGGDWREGLVIGLGMNDRGAVEIVLAGVALRAGLISSEVFSILVFMAIATTATVPFLLKWGVHWLEQRGELVPSAGSRSGVIIVGAGPLARVLANELKASQDVTLLDSNAANCAAAKREGLHAVQGDALSSNVLLDAGIEDAGMVVGLTANAEINVLVAKRAHDAFLVPEIYALLTREDAGLAEQLELSGARPLFGQAVNLDEWDRRVLSGLTETLLKAVEGEGAETLEDAQTLPLSVRRGELRSLFHREALAPGDNVMVLTTQALG